MPTSGAVKQGIGNVNSYTNFFRKVAATDGYSNLNFMKVRMLQAGIQLDKEHHADNSVLSLMTQVISAACAKGFMVEDSENLEKAIKRFKRMVEKEGIIREYKKREYYEKPSTILNRKNKTLQRKLMKKNRKTHDSKSAY